MKVGEVKENLYRGSFPAVVRVALAVPIYAILTPFLLKYLGREAFALWSFNSTVIGLINLTDFGFKNSLLFHCAQSREDHQRIARLFGTALCLYLALWVLTVGAAWIFQTPIATLLGASQSLRDPAGFVILITALSFGLRFVATPFQSVIEAFEGVRYSQHVFLVWLLVNSALTFLLLPLNASLYTLGWISLASSALVPVAFYLRVRSRYHFVQSGTLAFDGEAVRALMRYGSGIYLATAMIALREPIFKVFLSRNHGLPAVADFEISVRLCTQLVSAVMSPLLGTFAAAAVLANRPAELAAVLRPLCGFTLLVLTPAALFLMSFSQPLVDAWLGSSGGAVAALLPWTFAAFAIYYIAEVPYQGIVGAGGSAYGGGIQVAVLAVICAALYLSRTQDYIFSVNIALLCGFAVFSIANYWTFRTRIAGQSLFTLRQLCIFMTPTLLYGIALAVAGSASAVLVPAFVMYLIAHVVFARRAGVVDVFGIVRRLMPTAV